MECKKCSLANALTKYLWLLALVTSTYTQMNDHLESTSELFPDSEDPTTQEKLEKIVFKYDDRIVIHVPKFNKCDDFVVKGLNKKTNIASFYNCSDCGYNKFLIYRFRKNEVYDLILYESHSDVPAAKLRFNASIGFREAPPIMSHVLTSSGPGWILFRLITRETVFDQLLTYEVTYIRLGSTQSYNMLQDWKKKHELVFRRISYAEDPPAVAPYIKCPQWRQRNSFCILLTEFIYPETEIGDTYSDYIFRIYTYHGVPSFNDPRNLKLIGKTKSKEYQIVIRLWNECDTTNNGCPELDLSPEVKERPTTTPKSSVIPSHPVLVGTQGMWPLFLAVFLFLACVMVPWFYIFIKRRSKNALLNYGNTVPEDRVKILETENWKLERWMESPPEERRKIRRPRRQKGEKGKGEQEVTLVDHPNEVHM